MTGEEKLRKFTEEQYKKQVTKVKHRIYHFLGWGHSNATAIIGETSVILVDMLDSDERAKRLRAELATITDKPVRTIIYTHSHPDHRGGAGAFMDSRPEVIAFAPAAPALEKTGLLQDIQNLRGARQFGYPLTDQEAISQGIGPREGITHGEHRAFVLPTTL